MERSDCRMELVFFDLCAFWRSLREISEFFDFASINLQDFSRTVNELYQKIDFFCYLYVLFAYARNFACCMESGDHITQIAVGFDVERKIVRRRVDRVIRFILHFGVF
jgi:hypothetical protein